MPCAFPKKSKSDADGARDCAGKNGAMRQESRTEAGAGRGNTLADQDWRSGRGLRYRSGPDDAGRLRLESNDRLLLCPG